MSYSKSFKLYQDGKRMNPDEHTVEVIQVKECSQHRDRLKDEEYRVSPRRCMQPLIPVE